MSLQDNVSVTLREFMGILQQFFYLLSRPQKACTIEWVLFKRSVQGLSHPITHSQSGQYICINCWLSAPARGSWIRELAACRTLFQ